MTRTLEADTIEIEEIRPEMPEVAEAPEPAEVEEAPRKRLDQLMRKVLARRDEVRATQQKLREIEIELRLAPDDKRTRFERMREAALNEYRKARAEAARTRNQLLNTLRMLPKANHIYLEAKVGNNAEMASLRRFVPEYFTTIHDWLAKRIRGFRPS